MSSVEEIKARLNIVDVVGSYLKLEKAGINWRARCPFHNEKTPSFYVSPSRGSYHCFGCNRGGDIFNFVQEMEGLEFVEALKTLAVRAGVELSPFDRQERGEKNKLSEIIRVAAEFYKNNLSVEPAVKEYFASRRLAPETVEEFELGYANNNWRDLLNHLNDKGIAPAEAEKVGLLIAKNGGSGVSWYDRFRGRIIFPIWDGAGRPVGMAGRVFGAQSDIAKYVNTPETPLYEKSKILYGYHLAKMAIREQNCAVLVEGYFDLMMSRQAGVKNVVAACGTALTDSHLGLIKRLSDNLVLAYDYDLAGLKASWRGIELARALGFSVKIAGLPKDLDPADVVAKNPALWQKAVKEAKHYIDFMIEALVHQGKTGLDLALAVNQYILPQVKALDKKMEQAHFVGKLAVLLDLSEEAIWQDLALAPVATSKTAPAKTDSQLSKISVAPQKRYDLIENRLFGILFWLSDKNSADGKTRVNLEERLSVLLNKDKFVKRKAEMAVIERKLAMEAELLYGASNRLGAEIEELLLNLKKEILREEFAVLMGEVGAAEREGGDVADKMARCQAVSEELNRLNDEFK